MQIVFVNYEKYMVSSGVHIHFIANEMTRLGHECTVVVPAVENTDNFGIPEYGFSSYESFAEDLGRGRYGRETIFHAWTPRENVRILTLAAARMLNAPYFVHLEDNERRILESVYNKPFAELFKEFSADSPIDGIRSHPILHQIFIAEANGVSVLMDKLAEFVPANVPTQLIWPACEREFFLLPQAQALAMRNRCGIPEDAAVIVYPGNVHDANVATVSQLYHALPLVEQTGHKIRLVRCCGEDTVITPDVIELLPQYVVMIPHLHAKKLPTMIAMADVLAQPGVPDAFDDYRFPSKLPLCLASGRPVILAKTNIGRFLEDGKNCLILEENTPEKIAEKIVWLLEHRAEAAAIGRNGRKFAAQNFSWTKTAKQLLDFYVANAAKQS